MNTAAAVSGRIPQVLVIDNYDSFTYNIVQYLGELGAKLSVEGLRTLDQRPAAAARHEMRVGAEALLARQLVVEVRRERRLERVALDRTGGKFGAEVVHGRSRSASGARRSAARRGRC